MTEVLSGGSSAWPQGMVISIEDHSSPIEELLWIREAYALQPTGDIPPPLVEPPAVVGRPDDAPAWEAAWVELWHAAVRHASIVITRERIDELMRTEDASPERREVLRVMRGPSWQDRFGDAALERGYGSWSEQRFETLIARPQQRLRDRPEHRSLAALVAAWRAGLTRIVTIPCRGDHTRVVSGSALLMTEGTRAEPERYAAALATVR